MREKPHEENNMAVKIEKKIVGYKLVSDEDKAQAVADAQAQAERASNVVQMGEPLSRPEILVGST